MKPVFLLAVLVMGTVFVGSFSLRPVHAGTIHVPADYPTIQKAINAASVNDTVLVAAGTYNERVSLNKTVHLAGAGMGASVIDGSGLGTVVNVTANAASITGFTIQNSATDGITVELLRVKNTNITENSIIANPSGGRPTQAGVDLFRSNNTLIDGNSFSQALWAVNLTWSIRNRISNNAIIGPVGVGIANSFLNTVIGNKFAQNEEGIDLTGPLAGFNNITRNIFRGASFSGVFFVDRPSGNLLVENTFISNHIGVNMQNVTGNTFYHNGFLRSDFRHLNHVFGGDGRTDVWDNRSLGGPKLGGNYWDDYTGTDADGDGIGDTPYHFPTNSTEQDSYPLMQPFAPVPLVVVGVSASPKSGSAPFTTTLTADVLGTLKPLIYLWNFSDGSPLDPNTSPSHTFSNPGNYTVRVSVRDSSGAMETGMVSVLVSAPGFPFWIIPVAIVLAVSTSIIVLIYYRRRKRSRDESQRVKGSRK